MFVKLFVIFVFSFGVVFGEDGLTGFISDDESVPAGLEKLTDNDQEISEPGKESEEEKKEYSNEDGSEENAPDEVTDDSQKPGDNEGEGEGKEDNPEDSEDAEWDCIAYSDTIRMCQPKKKFVPFEKKVQSSPAAIPHTPPEGVSDVNFDIEIKGNLEDWIHGLLGAISKVHDKIHDTVKKTVKSPLKIIGDRTGLLGV